MNAATYAVPVVVIRTVTSAAIANGALSSIITSSALPIAGLSLIWIVLKHSQVIAFGSFIGGDFPQVQRP